MARTATRNVRLTAEQLSALDRIATSRGTTVAALMARMVGEGIAAADHPGIVFRDGSSGRCACLDGGPTVWQIARRAAELRDSGHDGDEVVRLLAEEAGTHERTIRRAIDYWATHREEVDADIEFDRQAEASLRHRQDGVNALLSA